MSDQGWDFLKRLVQDEKKGKLEVACVHFEMEFISHEIQVGDSGLMDRSYSGIRILTFKLNVKDGK